MRIRVLILVLLGLTVNTFGQSTYATITGSVTDPSGAVLPGVEVKAVHKTLGLVFTTLSNDSGIYTLPEVREGEYAVSAALTGFKEFVAEGVVLRTRTARRLDIRLEIGEMQQKVEVVAEAGAIETERAVISSGRSQEELQKLPISNNSLYFMFMTLPMAQARGSSPSFAGSRTDQYQMSVDGGSINTGEGGVISNLANQNETYKELKVEMVNNSAEHSGLGHVLLVSRSGENKVHGFGFYNYQSPWFRARDFFDSTRANGIDLEYGFGIGGPFYIPKLYDGRNKTFFYFTADQDSGSKVREELAPNVPLERWRNGDFSVDGLQIKNPLTGAVYADGKIPASAINPVAKLIQDRFWPLPNNGDLNTLHSRNYLEILQGEPSEEWHGVLKLDHNFRPEDSVFASYQLHQVDVNDWETSLPAFGWKNWKRQSKVFGMGWNHTFSPTLLNKARFSHAFNGYPRRGPLDGKEVLGYLGSSALGPLQGLHNGLLPDGGGATQVSFTGLSITQISQQVTINPGFVNKNRNFHNDLSWFRGRHNLKMGIQVGRVQFTQQSMGSCTFGCVQFSKKFSNVPGVSKSGHAYADFLFGTPTSMSRGVPEPLEDRLRTVVDMYVQDDFKVSSNLTLNLGLRYEYHAPYHDASGLLSMFDPSTGRIVVTDQGMSAVSPYLPEGYVDIVSASSAGFPATSLIYSDKNNFGPRVGFAYRPTSDGNTVVRAGYGIFYDMTPPVPQAAGTPFIQSEPTYTNDASTLVAFPRVFPDTGSGRQATVSIPSAINPSIIMPYTQQWNLSVEHERWNTGFRASYVGTTTHQMFWTRNINAPVVDDQLFINKSRPFPTYPGISLRDNGGNHIYNGLNLDANYHASDDFSFQTTYTWARDMGDDTNPFNPYDRASERGPDEIVPNQRFIANTIYHLPFGHGKKLLGDASRAVDMLVGGWEFSIMAAMQSGKHLTPSYSLPDPTGILWTDKSNRPTTSMRPDLVGNPKLDNPTWEQWYNVAAFAAPPVGRVGNAGRGIITGPGLNVFHAGLHKSVRFHEDLRFVVGLVASNVFNHTNFTNPNMTVSATTAGEITDVGGPNNSNPGDRAQSRQMFLRLRLEF